MAQPSSGLYFSSDPTSTEGSSPSPSSVPPSIPPSLEGFPSAQMSLLELELHNERVNKLQGKVC